jgi:LAO/AO transport system kinase
MNQIAEAVLAGDIRTLARAASWIEQRRPEAETLLREIFVRTGRGLLIGVTGPPGAGKSTLCDQLVGVLRREGKTVAVIAVDPSSPFSGGAILGDRIRMQRHHADPGVFIRSMATRGWMGGLAAATLETALLLDAAGFDVILIETVGAGQDEVDVARLAGVTLVVLAPGMGDDVQAIKAGMMEIADVLVLNKADLAGADQLEQQLRTTLAIGASKELPAIVRTVAEEGTGVAETLAAARAAARTADDPARVAHLWSLRLRDMLRERLMDRYPAEVFLAAAEEVAARRTDPYTVLNGWLNEH